MKRMLAALLICVLLLQSLPDSFALDKTTDYDGYIIGMLDAVAQTAVEKTGCEELADGLYYADTIREVRALSALGDVDYCEPNYILTTQDNYDGYTPAQWNLLSVEASSAWAHLDAAEKRDRLGDGVTVAVIDSGVMAEHPDLENVNILDYVALSSETDGLDDYHGTFIAGLLAAAVNNGIGTDGMTPNVTILPICITWGGGKTDIKTAVQGIQTAVELGADVIAFSIGGTSDNTALREACEYAESQGVILVTCAGNYSSGRTRSASNYMYPAAYDCVVTVSACKKDGETVVFDSDYSYFNDAVNVSAPGTDIVSLYLDGGTATRTGTSFAAPVVTAMAVMAKQADPAINRERFVELLAQSAVDLGEPGYDVYYGSGYVNVPAFLSVLDASIAGDIPSDPDDPTPEDPTPDDPTPEDPTPEDPTPEDPTPDDPTPVDPMPDDPTPEDPTPDDPTPDDPTPDDPTPVDPIPDDPTPDDPTPDDPTPVDPTPDDPTPEDHVRLPYADVSEDDWSYPSIVYVTMRGYMTGTGQEMFSPSLTINRAMFTTVLYRIAGEPEITSENPFTDVEADTWYSDAVIWAARERIIHGYGNGAFGTMDPMTREQMVAIFWRYTGKPTADDADLSAYKDVDKIDGWARDAFAWAVSVGIISGKGNGMLDPKGTATRAEVAQIMMNYDTMIE